MLSLIFVFLYIGLFTIGGGMIAIPLIQQQVVDRGWILVEDFYRMVAIAESTPGPIGINIATYVGFYRFGVIGALLATISFIIPSFIIVSVLSDLLRKHREKDIVKNWFLFVKAAIIGLIGFTLVNVAEFAFLEDNNLKSIKVESILLFIVLSVAYYFLQKKPWIVIILGAFLGVIVF